MFQSSQSRFPWWLLVVASGAVALLLLSTSHLAPVRDVVARVTLPAQRVLREAGQGARDFVGSVGDLATLRARNTELEQLLANLTVENVRLHEVEAENARLRGLLSFAQANPSYDYKGGQVIGRVVASEPSSIVQGIRIDLGSRNGILPGMPVVTERGLVGRITDVYTSSSQVLLLTDSNSGINVILQNARLRGVLRGRASHQPVMDYIPPNETVNVGDIVVTSGEGGGFPKGVPVGQVVEVERNDVEMFQRAIVRTTVDFATLDTVLVVTNFLPIEDLENLPED